MLRLRLEVVASENLKDICVQAARIATANGIEVVFELNGNDVVAKPGMNPESLSEIMDYLNTPLVVGNNLPKEPKEPKPEKEKAGKGGKGKSKPNEPADENTTSATAPETEVQKEGV